MDDANLAPRDISTLVRALLEGIERGELRASPGEVRFLASIDELLSGEARPSAWRSRGVRAR